MEREEVGSRRLRRGDELNKKISPGPYVAAGHEIHSSTL